MGRWATEILKWVYVLVVASTMFLFFCLLLDAFSYLFLGGWRALLGKWPIFSGTVSSVIYGPPILVLFLLATLAGISRIILGDKTPSIVAYLSGRPPIDDRRD